MNATAPGQDRARPATARPGTPLRGEARVPGDKSISHRALLLGFLAEGESRINNLLEAEDVMATVRAVRALGGGVKRNSPGDWCIVGGGLGAVAEPAGVIDCGNAGTTARLLAGIIAANPVTAVLDGDASLRSRPMERVLAPMRAVGAQIQCREGGRLPASLQGTARPLPLDWTLGIPSAQVKSAILLAGLHCAGQTRISEPVLSRDHTERMLRAMGVAVESVAGPDGAVVHTLCGESEPAPCTLRVPGDPSAAALVAAAALASGAADVTLPDVCANPTRCGFFETLQEMGANLELGDAVETGSEPVRSIRIQGGRLRGVRVPGERAVSMIDEYPALAVLAALAQGETVMEGVGELRAKESDRLAAMAAGLQQCGVEAVIEGDTLRVAGQERPTGGVQIDPQGDHRIAMAFLALGLGVEKPVGIADIRSVATSFPEFPALLRGLGAQLDDA